MACELFAYRFRVSITHKPTRFLLARLHVDSLIDKRTKAKVISALKNLSKGSEALEDAYSEAITRIDGQLQDDRVLAKNVLSFISYAQRPLTTGELCHALAVGVGDEELDFDNIPDVEDILSVCAGLVTVDEESQVIRLVHYTTQDYLEDIREKWNPDAQYDIASTCLTYLCFKPFRSGSCPSNAEFDSRLEKHKFLDYAARYWHQHVVTVQEETSELAMFLLRNSKLIECALQTTSIYTYSYGKHTQSFPKQATGLHLVVSLGLLHLSKEVLFWVESEKMTSVDVKDDDGRTPLMWAARNGNKHTVKLLLSTGKVDVDAKDNNGKTALIAGASAGQKETVELLLSTGKVDINAKDNNGWTALIASAAGGRKETVELLLSTGKVDVYAKDDEGRTALIAGADGGHKETVELLLRTGNFDVDTKDDDGWTALMVSAAGGHKETVELLLSTGKVDINARNIYLSTSLISASYNGHEDIVGILLGTGKVDINAKDDDGETALLVAAQRGHGNIVKMLLAEQHTTVHVKNQMEWTPLMWAVQNGHKNTVELLLATGKIDVDAKQDNGLTLLELAERAGRKDIVRLLQTHRHPL
jgi:ankyrin repeat protein